MSYRLGGRNSLPYLGVEAPTPANTVFNKRSPTSTDSQNFNLGTWWLKTNVKNEADELWILISLEGGVATWVQLYPSNAGGASEFVEDSGVANDMAGVINCLGGAGTGGYININTVGSGNTISIALNDTIQWPATNSNAQQGAIYLDSGTFMHAFGTNCTWLGGGAGSITHSTQDCTGIGTGALIDVQASGVRNTGIGFGSLSSVTVGTNCVGLGYLSGSNYTNEDFNICISNTGTVGDNNTIRIGSAGDHTKCYISGIYGTSIGGTNAPVFIDNTGKLGTLEAGTSLAGSSFMATVGPTDEFISTSSSGNGVVGTNQIMQISYNNFGSAFFPGNGTGTPARFTAPIDGYFQFQWSCYLDNNDTNIVFQGYIILNNTTYYMFAPNRGTSSQLLQSIAIPMNATDFVTFNASWQTGTSPFNVVFKGGDGTLAAPYATSVFGLLLKTF